jgi:hypothetical protein
MHRRTALLAAASFAALGPALASSGADTALLGAAAKGDVATMTQLVRGRGANANARDAQRRTPLILAAYGGHLAAAAFLLKAGAEVNAQDDRRYDILTLAAADGRTEMVKLALAHGANARAITSPYTGTALIAAAHHGHVEVVAALIAAKAPLDHVNNIGWTALMESIVLGDGGPRHTETLRLLLAAGADPNIPDKQGVTPLAHARQRGYAAMVAILEQAGGK